MLDSTRIVLESQIDSLSLVVENCKEIVRNDSLLIDRLYGQVDANQQLINTYNGAISNQLSVLSIIIAVITLFITVVSIFFGFYINNRYQKVVEINKTISGKRKQIENSSKEIRQINDVIKNRREEIEIASKEVSKINEAINHNMTDLYQQLHREETVFLLNRLVEEPHDVQNLSASLLSRQLKHEDYELLKCSMMKILEEFTYNKDIFFDEYLFMQVDDDYKTWISYVKSYYLLLFQHFSDNFVLDEDLNFMFVDGFDFAIQCAFQRDIIKSTEDISKALKFSDSVKKISLLKSYLKALNKSKFSRLQEIGSILKREFEQDGTLSYVLEECKKDGVTIDLFSEKQSDLQKK